MKKIIFNRIHFSMLVCFIILGLQLTSCEKEEDNAPIITGVLNYAPAPNDTVLDALVPGQYVVLEGVNLKDAQMISFNGIPATFSNGIFADNYAAVKVPDVIPFPSIAEEDLNKIHYVTSEGETFFDFPIIAGPPVIAAISNELPTPGNVVAILGTNLFQIESVSFGGTNITDLQLSDDGTIVSFLAPEPAQIGPVKVVTRSGADSTIYNVNDYETGVICNFDDIYPGGWYNVIVQGDSEEFPGNHGTYAVFDNDVLAAGNSAWWEGGRSINLPSLQQMPVEDLDLPLDNFAVKFELNVPGDWIGTQLRVMYDPNYDYQMVFEPWKAASGAQILSATTAGQWMTVTLPFTMFKKADDDGKTGKGETIGGLVDLLDDSGNGALRVYTAKESDVPNETGFRGAIDNIRVVKIK